MNRIKDVNRIFLGTVLLSVIGSLFVSLLLFVDQTYLLSLLASQLLMVFPAAVYMMRWNIPVKEWIVFRKISFPKILMLAGFFLASIPVLNLIQSVSLLFFHQVINQTMTKIISQWPLPVSIICIAVIPAFFEESIYRGVFFLEYRKMGLFFGAFCSGMVFGLLHFNLNQFLYAFYMGVWFALLVDVCDSLLASVLLHFAINLSSVVSAYQAGTARVTVEKSALIAKLPGMTLAAGIGLIISIGIYAVLRLWKKEQKKDRVLPAREMVTPSFVAAVLICVALMISNEMT
ncbi:MAG: type II CAAX endopeptidase family protein [Clostridiales bacterium]|nr:type II CAAX endopeptidase family protein [Clostridiales bacterium]